MIPNHVESTEKNVCIQLSSLFYRDDSKLTLVDEEAA